MVPPPQMPDTGNTPEMDVSDSDKKSLKIWAHNFEKHKSYNFLSKWGGGVLPPPTSIKNYNFCVFQSYELRFSEIFCRYLKRPFPGYFLYPASVEGVPFFLRKKFKIIDPNLKILASEHGDFTFCDGFWLDLWWFLAWKCCKQYRNNVGTRNSTCTRPV